MLIMAAGNHKSNLLWIPFLIIIILSRLKIQIANAKYSRVTSHPNINLTSMIATQVQRARDKQSILILS
jgi:hypothetical protein